MKTAVDRKAPPVFGKGMNSWCFVHIDDGKWFIRLLSITVQLITWPRRQVSDFYIFLLDTLFSPYSEMPGHGKQGYYFLSTFPLGLTPIAEAVGEELVKAGFITSAEIVPYTKEELRKIGVCVSFLFLGCRLISIESRSGNSSLQIASPKGTVPGNWVGNHGMVLQLYMQTSK